MGSFTPVRDTGGRIVDFIDSQGRLRIGDTPLVEPALAPTVEPDESTTPRRRGITMDQRRPLAELLGGQGGQPAAPGKPTVPTRRTWLAWGAGALLAVLVAWAIAAQGTPAPAPTATPTAAPTAAATAPAAAVVPTSRPMLPRAIAAFDAPDGTVVGALDAGRCYTLEDKRDGWRQLNVCGSGLVWVRAWEMDGSGPPTATPEPTPIPLPTADPRPVQVIPQGPPVTCQPVVDGDNGNAYLGEACGVTSEERQQRALELLQQATPFLP
jgi:hypothetical protein